MAGNFLGISGSLRKASYNRKLVLEAGRLFGPLKLTEADINLPLYDGDVEDERDEGENYGDEEGNTHDCDGDGEGHGDGCHGNGDVVDDDNGDHVDED